MRVSRRLAVAATLVVAAAAAVVLMLGGGEESSPRLDALREDPLGRHAPGGQRPVKLLATVEGETLGKPKAARYARWFALRPGDERSALDEAARVARGAGWRLEPNGDGTAFVGSKTIAGGPASAVIAVRGAGGLLPPDVPPPALSINLQR